MDRIMNSRIDKVLGTIKGLFACVSKRNSAVPEYVWHDDVSGACGYLRPGQVYISEAYSRIAGELVFMEIRAIDVIRGRIELEAGPVRFIAVETLVQRLQSGDVVQYAETPAISQDRLMMDQALDVCQQERIVEYIQYVRSENEVLYDRMGPVSMLCKNLLESKRLSQENGLESVS